MILRSIPALLLVAALGGCTVGPAYQGPPPTAPLPGQFAGAVAGAPVSSASEDWWTLFNDPVLDELEKRALAGSPDIAIAEARVRGARSALRLERANGLPRANAQLSTIQAHLPGVAIDQGAGAADDDFDFYNAGFDASWEFDLFGGQRRKVEASRASLAVIEAEGADARLSLTAEVAMTYAELRERQQRIALTRADSESRRRSLALVDQRRDRGTVSPLDAERMRAMVETADAELAPLIAEAEARKNALAILTGAMPGSLEELLASASSIPAPPPSVDVTDPAALLQRRPDIRAAERRLAAETARIGVARSARFPKVRLMGIIGLGGSDPSDMGDFDKIALLAAPTLQWDLLDFGRGAARVRQAEAKRDEAEAVYRRTVLAALSDAQNALTRFGQRRNAVASLARAKAASDRALLLTRARFEAGTATMLDMQESERQSIAAEQRLVAARTMLAMDFIVLQKALGLGLRPVSS